MHGRDHRSSRELSRRPGSAVVYIAHRDGKRVPGYDGTRGGYVALGYSSDRFVLQSYEAIIIVPPETFQLRGASRETGSAILTVLYMYVYV